MSNRQPILLSELDSIKASLKLVGVATELAYHANVGALVMDEVARTQIEESYDHVIFLRKILLKALGMRE